MQLGRMWTGFWQERKRVRMRSSGKTELLSKEECKKKKEKKKQKPHKPEKPHASRKLISFILVGQAPCGRSSWPTAQQRRWCALYKSSGLPDEPYHLQRELCPFSHKAICLSRASRGVLAAPLQSKKNGKLPGQLALTESDVHLRWGWRTEVPQGTREGWGRLRGGQRLQKILYEWADGKRSFWE